MTRMSRKALLRESNDEEVHLLNWLRDLEATFVSIPGGITSLDPRWRAVARTHFEEGFMALNRAIMGGRTVQCPPSS